MTEKLNSCTHHHAPIVMREEPPAAWTNDAERQFLKHMNGETTDPPPHGAPAHKFRWPAGFRESVGNWEVLAVRLGAAPDPASSFHFRARYQGATTSPPLLTHWTACVSVSSTDVVPLL